MKRLGYLADPLDPRDEAHSWGSLLGNSAPSIDSVNLWRPSWRTLDQEGQSCTGFAVAYATRIAHAELSGTDPGELSPYALYWLGRRVWGAHKRDAGSYLKTTFQALVLNGCPRTKIFEGGVFMEGLPWDAVRDGFDYRGIRAYRKVSTLREARNALSEGVPLVGGWAVGPEFESLGRHDEPYNGESVVSGGHAMCIYGYSRDGNFRIVNSWGSDWGNGGHCLVTPEFLLSSDRLWACDTRQS